MGPFEAFVWMSKNYTRAHTHTHTVLFIYMKSDLCVDDVFTENKTQSQKVKKESYNTNLEEWFR